MGILIFILIVLGVFSFAYTLIKKSNNQSQNSSKQPQSGDNSSNSYQSKIEQIVFNADMGDKQADEEFHKLDLSESQLINARINVYTPLALQGDVKAQKWLGLSYRFCGDEQSSLYWYEQAANQGDTDAMMDIAHGYTDVANDYGTGYGVDPEKESYWRKKASDLGNAEAMARVAEEYYIYDGSDADNKKAFDLWEKSAQKGNTSALIALAKKSYGNILNPNYNEEKKISLLLKAIDGDGSDYLKSTACQELAECYGSAYIYEFAKPKDTDDPQKTLYWLYKARFFLIVDEMDTDYIDKQIRTVRENTGIGVSDETFEKWKNEFLKQC